MGTVLSMQTDRTKTNSPAIHVSVLWNILTNRFIFAIVCRLRIHIISRKENHPMRERQKELKRKRKRKEETLRAKNKAAKAEAAAKKGK